MGYWYYFFLQVVKLPPAISEQVQDDENTHFEMVVEPWLKEVGKTCNELRKADYEFPKIAVKDCTGAGGHGTGDRDGKLQEAICRLSKIYPEAIFAFYHFYWDCSKLCIYTVTEGKIVKEDESSVEEMKIGNFVVHTAFEFESTTIPRNMSRYVTPAYTNNYEY